MKSEFSSLPVVDAKTSSIRRMRSNESSWISSNTPRSALGGGTLASNSNNPKVIRFSSQSSRGTVNTSRKTSTARGDENKFRKLKRQLKA